MTTIFVADPRPVFQKLIEHVVRANLVRDSLTPSSNVDGRNARRLVTVCPSRAAKSTELSALYRSRRLGRSFRHLGSALRSATDAAAMRQPLYDEV